MSTEIQKAAPRSVTVSFYRSRTDVVGSPVHLVGILHGIKTGRWSALVQPVRDAEEMGDETGKKAAKGRLPAFTPSVHSTKRGKNVPFEHSGFVVLDFDHLCSTEEAERLRDVAAQDRHVAAAFLSPSGRGVKIIVAVGHCADAAEHARAFNAVADYFEQVLGVKPDLSGCDLNRLCYVSHDSGAFIRDGETAPFTQRATITPPTTSTATDQTDPPSEWDVAVVRSALAFIPANCNRADWLRVACAVKNALGESGFEVFDQWSATAPERYDGAEAEKLWASLEPSTPGGVTVATLFRMAEERGWRHPSPPPSAKASDDDAVAVALQPRMIYFDHNSKHFLVRDSRGEWAPQNEAAVKRILRQQGVDPRPRRGEPLSELEASLVKIQTENNVAYAGPVAGYRAGLHETPDTRFLVTKGPVIIAADPARPWPTLRTILTGMLGGGMQLVYLLGWLKVARIALTSGKFAPGQALAIAGPAESAKSLLQGLITMMLGGRSARPYQFMAGQTSFNAHMFAAEHQMIEDESPATDFRSRRTLGAMVKSITVNQEQSCHRKHATPVMLKPFWRLSITVNDEPENLMVLPPLDESLEDKIILLKAERKPMPMPTATPAERDHFWKTLVAELPGLIAHVESFQIPADLVSSRFGIIHYHHPELLAKLDDLAPESKLLAFIEGFLLLGQKTWKGKASDLERMLTDQFCPYSYEARKLFSWATAAGTYLGRLRRRYPDRFVYAQTGEERDRLWTIHARNPVAGPAASTPDLDLTGGGG